MRICKLTLLLSLALAFTTSQATNAGVLLPGIPPATQIFVVDPSNPVTNSTTFVPGDYDPTDPQGTGQGRAALVIGGEIVAFKFQDFWSYSTAALINAQRAGFLPEADFGDYTREWGGTGIGGEDIIVYGQGAIKKNPDGFDDGLDATTGNGKPTFPNPTDSDNFWGNGGPGKDTTVDTVLEYLTVGGLFPNNTIPTFRIDINQEGADDSLSFNGLVEILSADGSTVIKSWSFDPFNDEGPLDRLDQPLSPPSPGSDDVTNNLRGYVNGPAGLGAGKVDFVAFAQDMDLSMYSGQGYLFRATVNFIDLNNGPETLSLSRRDLEVNIIPEPSSMAIFGLGSLGVAFAPRLRRRVKKAQEER